MIKFENQNFQKLYNSLPREFNKEATENYGDTIILHCWDGRRFEIKQLQTNRRLGAEISDSLQDGPKRTNSLEVPAVTVREPRIKAPQDAEPRPLDVALKK